MKIRSVLFAIIITAGLSFSQSNEYTANYKALEKESTNSSLSVSNGPLFQSFIDKITTAPVEDRQAIADSFINAQSSLPYIEEDTIAVYIYKGNASSVTIPGDANGWTAEAFPMTQLSGTDLWYKTQVFEIDARLDYKFVTNGNNWILDPRNPNRVTGGHGPNSELRMPGFEQPLEIEHRPDIPHGILFDTTFSSNVLNNSRRIRIYLPPGYDENNEVNYQMMLFHDGLEFITLANANNTLDYLIYEKKINPIIGVFVPPVDRNNEYAWNNTMNFESFICDELMPHLLNRYRISERPEERGMIGASYGGVISMQICYNRPDLFGLCAPISTALWARNRDIFNLLTNGEKKNVKWYMDWGTYEGEGIAGLCPIVKDKLIELGCEVEWNAWHDGHSWGNWRGHLDNALEYLFPYDPTVSVEENETIPEKFGLLQNYPNPFNPSTTIEYTIPNSIGDTKFASPTDVTLIIYDLLGRKVETLVNESKSAGNYSVQFNASDLAGGIYLSNLVTDSGIRATAKMVLLK